MTKDEERQDLEASRERDENPGENHPGTSNMTEKKLEKLPRVVLEEVLLDTRVVTRTRPGPKTRKEKKMFGNVRPNASSPPPSGGMDFTTDEDKQGPNTRPSSIAGATDVANLADFSENESGDSAASVRTAASGATKRAKKALPNMSKKAKNKGGQNRIASSEEEVESTILKPIGKRKPGRPVTTGKGVEIRARVEAKKELQHLEKEKRNIEKILEGAFDPTEYRGGRHSKRAEDMEEKLQYLPSRDIAAQMLKAAKQVESVAVTSSNLKGGYIKILKDAALQMALGVDALVCRSSPPGNENAREMERLREEIRNLREEVEKLRTQKDKGPMLSPQEQQGAEKMETEEDDGEKRGGTPPLTPHPVHPPKNEWPAIRPAIQGVRKKLNDGEDEKLTSKSASRPASEKEPLLSVENLKAKDIDVRKIFDEKFQELSSQISSQISAQIKEEVGRLLPTQGGKASLPSPPVRGPDRARINTPKATAPKRDAEECPVPAGKRKEEKGRSLIKKTALKGTEKNETGTTPLEKRTELATTMAKEKKKEESWAEVVKRKAKNKTKTKESGGTLTPAEKTKSTAETKKPQRRRIPRTSAIVLTCPKGQYAETMTEIREKIKLSEVGIQGGITTRTAMTGALIMEIPGTENEPKADALASRMREVLKDKEGIKISRPTKTAEIRVLGLEYSIRKEEVVEAVMEKGACRIHEIQAGEIRRMAGRQGSLWLRLPLIAAKKAVKEGTIQVGWSKAKIVLLEARPLRCHKCLEKGHVRERCPNPHDRSNRCYRCGGVGHIAKECTTTPNCPICSDVGRRADHTLGSQQCTTLKRRGKLEQTNTPSTSRVERREKEEEKQPKPQRPQRIREAKTPSTSALTIEEAMETEPLEEGGEKRQ